MKIGIFCGAIGFGGSQNTTASIALELARRGHDVTLYIDKLRFRSREDISYLSIVHLSTSMLNPRFLSTLSIHNLIKTLRNVKRKRHDALLSVSFWPLPMVIIASVLLNIPSLYYQVAPCKRWITRIFDGLVIANSEETRDVLATWLKVPADAIHIVRARINLKKLLARSSRSRVSSGPVTVLMMSRLEGEKTEGIIKVIEAVRILNERRKRVVLRICGDGLDRRTIQGCAKRVNERAGREIVTLLGFVSSVDSEIRDSDIAVGVGRCAWEAMACSRATVIVGGEGLGGVVCMENLARLMYYNFTARGSTIASEPVEIANVLGPIVDSPQYRQELGEYALNVIKQHYDVGIGAMELEQLVLRAQKMNRGQGMAHKVKQLCGVICIWMGLWAKSISAWFLKPRISFRNLVIAVRLGASSKVD